MSTTDPLTTIRGPLYYRHALPIRIMHWINVIAFFILLMSGGLQIFNAHPALNWGKSSYNGQLLPIANGAPIRVRIERQLGYKMAKYIMGIQLVDSFHNIGEGKGGYWEDQGYEPRFLS